MGKSHLGFLVCLLLLPNFASAAEPVKLNVWPGKPPGETGEIGKEKVLANRPNRRKVMRITNVTNPTITVYRPEKAKDTGAAVVICPGGGYSILAWDLEGTEVAEWLNSIGVTGIVLKYRVPRRPDAPGGTPPKQPLMDAQRAMSLVRSKAKEWKLDPSRIGILGFSAGGHLSAHASTNWDKRAYKSIDDVDKISCRPDFAILIYPAYLTTRRNRKLLSSEIRVTKRTPPMFFAHAADDRVPAANSIVLSKALKKLRIATSLNVYKKGGHGFGLRPSDFLCSQWPRRCESWLREQRLLGKNNNKPNDD
ncbi:MAG: alpha/beta hydrolase [Gemmataceae bacterium]